MSKAKRYNISFVRKNAEELFVNRGLQKEEAHIIVDSMLEADCSGIETHGIRMIGSYIQKLENKEFSIVAPEIVNSTSAITVLDAKNCIGAISANEAVNIVIDKAKESGIHVVFSRNSNTYGPAFYYVEKIAKAGLVGVTCCNSPAAMPAMNGRDPLLGTNPLAFACSSKSKGTVLIDMATSIVAKSKFAVANANGETLQEGWALDKDGNPTIDPMEAIKGLVLPMAGPKGYGLAMMIDILAGVMSGAGYLNKVGKFYSQTGECMNVGQMFVAIDPSVVYGENFGDAMDEYLSIIRASSVCDGKKITIPGDNKQKKRKDAIEKGLLLTEDTVNKLSILFQQDLEETSR